MGEEFFGGLGVIMTHPGICEESRNVDVTGSTKRAAESISSDGDVEAPMSWRRSPDCLLSPGTGKKESMLEPSLTNFHIREHNKRLKRLSCHGPDCGRHARPATGPFLLANCKNPGIVSDQGDGRDITRDMGKS